MLMVSRKGRWDFAINPHQWMVGFNYYEWTWNVFFLCFRIGYRT